MMDRSLIPNVVTLINLIAGSTAVVAFLYCQYDLGIILVVVSGLADFADGLVARALGVQSELGKQLDSLADVISFGLVPGIIFYTLLCETQAVDWAAVPAFILTAFAAYRLGTFNLDTRQEMGFLGLPTPACTLLVVGYFLWIDRDAFGLATFFSESYILYPLIALLSYLMVAELPMFSLKFKALRWGGNEIKFIFAAIAVVALIGLRELALLPIMVLYILLSLGQYWTTRKKTS
jgi:CDP-diacylglycerol--serine O-phosphatidyltransferase